MSAAQPSKEKFQSMRNFEAFAMERRLYKNLPLSMLKDATVGIDLNHFVDTHCREALAPATGGVFSVVETTLDTLLEVLEKSGVKPLFVLSGLDIMPFGPTVDPGVSQRSQTTQQYRNSAWSQHNQGSGEDSIKGFEDVSFPQNNRALVQYLVSKKLEFMVAPYTCSSQLAYLLENDYVDAIYGISDAFLYNAEKLISSFDLRNANFQWISKNKVLGELNFNHHQFVEAGLAVGCEINKRTFPPVELMISSQPVSPMTAIRGIQEIAQAHTSVYASILAYPDHDEPSFAERFRRALAAVYFQPVLKDNGKVEPVANSGAPNDIHDFIGQRLPDEIMYYFSRGLIGPELLNALACGHYYVEAPLDGGESKQYHKLLENLWPVKFKALTLLTQRMHRYYQFKSFEYATWYGYKKSVDKIQPAGQAISQAKWKVSDSILKTTSPKFSTLVGLLSNDSFAKETLANDEELKSDNEMVSNATFLFLEAAEFVNKDHKLTAWGNVLNAAVQVAPDVAEQLAVLLALFRSGDIHGGKLEPDYDDGLDRGSDKDKLAATLVARVAAAITLRHKPVGYQGPLSRSLLAYQSFIKSQLLAYRELVESSFVALAVRADVERISRDDMQWSQLVPQLPFGCMPNVGTGLAMKTYLENVMDESVEKAKDLLATTFKQASDVTGDLKLAFGLWDGLYAGVKAAKEMGLTSDISQFADADAWLKDKRF